MDLPAYGARNVERVATGTWETLPGPTTPGMGVVGGSAPITGDEPGSGDRAGWESGAAVVPLELTGQQNPRRWEGPLLRLRVTYREGLVSAIYG
jgi:hypothetical protein